MLNPSDVLSNRDPGDDVQRRFRYQAACGALLCLECLDNEGVAEIFCEHHEDFLIRKPSGMYVGVQVKTRATHLGAFKSNEAPVVTALTRFVQLDREFPSSFETFILSTNCDFLDSGDQETNLPHVLRVLKAKPSAPMPGAMGIVIDGIRGTTGSSKKRIREVLCKVRLAGNLPKFEDITMNVATKIATLDTYKSLPLERLIGCATSLIDQVHQSSGLTSVTSLFGSISFSVLLPLKNKL